MLEIKEKGIYKVVDSSQVESWTCLGWRLVAVLENETVMPWSDTENFPANTPYNQGMLQNQYLVPSGYVTATNVRYHATSSPLFLLVQDEEAVAANLQHKVNTLETELAGLKKDSGDAVKRLVDVEKERNEFQTRLKSLIETQAKTIEQVSAGSKALADYKAEVLEKLKAAEEIIARDATRKRTAYERVVEGEFDDDAETLEVGDVRGRREVVADVPCRAEAAAGGDRDIR